MRAALDEISSRGIQTRFIRVYDYRIESCKGCRDCMRLGRCVIQDDDVEELLRVLRESSGAVIGAPVYWDGPPGRMKDLIDRSHGYYASEAGTLLRGLRFSLISVATASGFEPHEDVMLSWLEYYGGELVGKARIYAREKGDLPSRTGEIEKAKHLGSELLNSIHR